MSPVLSRYVTLIFVFIHDGSGFGKAIFVMEDCNSFVDGFSLVNELEVLELTLVSVEIISGVGSGVSVMRAGVEVSDVMWSADGIGNKVR